MLIHGSCLLRVVGLVTVLAGRPCDQIRGESVSHV